MKRTSTRFNDFVIKFANVNGSGSASANGMFAKALFRMGIPVAARNIFPSNIQGLPTWFEVRANEKGYLGRREGVDLMVAMNAATYAEDVASIVPGGTLFYDNSKPLDQSLNRSDVQSVGVPLARLMLTEFQDPKQRQLFKNICYLGVLSALLDLDFEILTGMVAAQYRGKDSLIEPNIRAMQVGRDYAADYLDVSLDIQARASKAVGNRIMVDGNSAAGLGCIYGGATVCAWYPITPSTSVAEAFEKYAKQMRVNQDGTNRYASIQAEDELSAIGIVIGAAWNGARAFTATSGPGLSLMTEFLGLAYFAEIPAVLIDVQRAGPSTGMPTRTQQADLLSAAYASHGDTRQVMLFPADPKECFDFCATALDLADRLQTPVMVMSDLDLGMNIHLSEPFSWDDGRRLDRGKVLTREELEEGAEFGRYLDVDGDGIGYRTYPGTHPERGAFFTRGTSRDAYANYTEKPQAYEENMARLLRKWKTAALLVPEPIIHENQNPCGILYYGTTDTPMQEALDLLLEEGIELDTLRIRAFPFSPAVEAFIESHELLFLVEQNRDAQMKTLVLNELEEDPAKFVSVLYFGGLSITAQEIYEQIRQHFSNLSPAKARRPLREVQP